MLATSRNHGEDLVGGSVQTGGSGALGLEYCAGMTHFSLEASVVWKESNRHEAEEKLPVLTASIPSTVLPA